MHEKEEKIDVVKLLHKGSWSKINNYFSKDLPLPYIYKTTRAQAYRELFDSIEDSGILVPEAPVTHALLYFYTGKITDSLGRPMRTNIFYGGTLVPEKRAKNDSEEELSVSITRENIRNFLRFNTLIYGTALASLEYHRNPEISNFLDEFDKSTSAALAKNILGMETEAISKVLLRDGKITKKYLSLEIKTKEEIEKVEIPMELLLPSVEEIEESKKEIDEIGEKIKDYSPINEWRRWLEIYSELKGNPQFLLYFDRFYEQFKRTVVIKRRDIEGKWEELKPIL